MQQQDILLAVTTLLLTLSAGLCRPADSCPIVTFSCPPLPPVTEPAKDVYNLRPQDIKVVMALGDSITAGFGMMGSHGSLIGDIQEYRGQSWSIGGDANASTVATFLRYYTPDIIGGSLGNHIFEFCYDILCPPFQYEPQKDVFNAAQSGAMVPNLVTHEFDYLYKQLTSNPEVDMENDWKLLSVFVGTNDLCLGCSGGFPTLTADDYYTHLMDVLEEVRTKIPKVFVNLVSLGYISQIYNLSLQSPHCMSIHRLITIECICAFLSGAEGDKLRNELDSLIAQYNEKMLAIASYYAQKHYSDFTVVVQPFLSNAQADNFTIDFLSTLDCFHPSYCAHQHMAKSLWNNMLTPMAKKKDYFDFEPIICPTNTTLLYTY